MKIDPTWHPIDGYSACLVFEGGNPQRPQDRMAVVDKTPRIRIRRADVSGGFRDAQVIDDWKNWAEGQKGTGPSDARSRAWCIEALRVFGHEVSVAPPEPEPVKFMVFKYNNGPSAGAVVRLSPDVVKIGPLPSSHLRIDDPRVSRMHAVIETRDDGVFIIDLGPAAGTFVNGKKVNTQRLVSGDVLTLGSTQVIVEFVT